VIALAALLLQVATPAEPPKMTVGEFRAACAQGTGGDDAAMSRCRGLVSEIAKEIETNPETSTCMSTPSPTIDDLAWAAIDGLAAVEIKDEGDARSAVTATLMTAYPCGIAKPS
jgi:hypothetical protein